MGAFVTSQFLLVLLKCGVLKIIDVEKQFAK